MSTSFQKLELNSMHAQLPLRLKHLPTNQWLHLCVDVVHLFAHSFLTSTAYHRGITGITISGAVHVRRIFTVDNTLVVRDTDGGGCDVLPPRDRAFPVGVDSTSVLIDFQHFHITMPTESKPYNHNDAKLAGGMLDKPRIAFGKRVTTTSRSPNTAAATTSSTASSNSVYHNSRVNNRIRRRYEDNISSSSSSSRMRPGSGRSVVKRSENRENTDGIDTIRAATKDYTKDSSSRTRRGNIIPSSSHDGISAAVCLHLRSSRDGDMWATPASSTPLDELGDELEAVLDDINPITVGSTISSSRRHVDASSSPLARKDMARALATVKRKVKGKGRSRTDDGSSRIVGITGGQEGYISERASKERLNNQLEDEIWSKEAVSLHSNPWGDGRDTSKHSPPPPTTSEYTNNRRGTSPVILYQDKHKSGVYEGLPFHSSSSSRSLDFDDGVSVGDEDKLEELVISSSPTRNVRESSSSREARGSSSSRVAIGKDRLRTNKVSTAWERERSSTDSIFARSTDMVDMRVSIEDSSFDEAPPDDHLVDKDTHGEEVKDDANMSEGDIDVGVGSRANDGDDGNPTLSSSLEADVVGVVMEGEVESFDDFLANIQRSRVSNNIQRNSDNKLLRFSTSSYTPPTATSPTARISKIAFGSPVSGYASVGCDVEVDAPADDVENAMFTTASVSKEPKSIRASRIVDSTKKSGVVGSVRGSRASYKSRTGVGEVVVNTSSVRESRTGEVGMLKRELLESGGDTTGAEMVVESMSVLSSANSGESMRHNRVAMMGKPTSISTSRHNATPTTDQKKKTELEEKRRRLEAMMLSFDGEFRSDDESDIDIGDIGELSMVEIESQSMGAILTGSHRRWGDDASMRGPSRGEEEGSSSRGIHASRNRGGYDMSGTTTASLGSIVSSSSSRVGEEEEEGGLELMYDPIRDIYYDPKSDTFYESSS